MAEKDQETEAEGSVLNIDQSTIQAASIRAEDVMVTRPITGEMGSTAESVNIEGGRLNQGPIPSEANIVRATIGTVNYIVQGGGGAQVFLVEDNSSLSTQSKPELISSEDLYTFINTCDEEIQFICEGRMDVTAGYKGLINEPSHEFSSYFEIIEEYFEGNLGSRRVQLKPGEDATFEHTESSGEAFQYEKLMETILHSKERVFAILGSVGAGKTVLSKRISRDLCKSKGTQELVLFKYFRDFSDEKEITLSHLLFGGLFEDDSMETKGYKWLLKNQDKAILILDGLDQSSSLINSKAKRINRHGKGKASEIISNIFRGDLLPKVKIVYTSREHAVASLEWKCRPDMVIMMTGLSQTDVVSLFISLVGDKGKDLWHKLVSQSHSLVPLLSTPVFVIFVAIVYRTSTGEPPQFVTGLMLEILELFKWSDHILDRNIAKIMSGLEKLSFDGLQQNMALFMDKHVKAAGLELEEIIDWMTKVPGRNKLNQYLLEGADVFFYSHQGIQEILCGCHVSKLSLPEFTTVVHEYLSNDRWSLTLRFLSGILFNKETEEDRANIGNVQEKQEVLKGMLSTKYKTARSSTEKLAVLAAISESNDKECIQSVVDSIVIYNYPINAASMHVIGSILRHCQLLENLVLENCSFDDTTAIILWQCVSGKDCNVQVKILNLGVNKLSDVALSSAGHIIQNDGELNLWGCSLTSSGLEHLQTALGDKKISRLNVCENTIGLELASILGEITKHSSVDHLRMEYCSLTDSELEKFLFEAEGSELLYLNVYGNSITRLAIEQIRKSIKVGKIVDDFDIDKSHRLPPRIIEIQKSMKEYGMRKDDQLTVEPILGAHGGKLMHDADQPTTHAYGKKSAAADLHEEFLSDQAEAAKLDEVIRECLSASYIKGELIGPEGGSINVLDCKANYPPNAFQKKTPVRHSVRSSYHAAPEGLVACSPEFGCTTFGVPFKGSVTITLPLHIIPEDGQVVISKKKGYNSPLIEFLVCPVNEKHRTVTFQVSHFCSVIAHIKNYFGFRGKVHLSHYLFYKPKTWQLITLTCVDQSSVKTDCVANCVGMGFREALPVPDEIVLYNNECIIYRYSCIEPETSALTPDGEISITKSDAVDLKRLRPRSLRLQPKPLPGQDSVIRRVIKPPHGSEEISEIVLEWMTQRSRENTGGIERGFPHGPAGAGGTDENVAGGGIVSGSGESAQTATGPTVVKQIWQGGEASNPAVLMGDDSVDVTAVEENELAGIMSAQETHTSDDASVEIELLGDSTGAVGPEGNAATGETVPGGAGSKEESLFGEAAATSAMVAGGATAVKQLWAVGGASNSADVVGSELGSGGNVLAGEAAVAQHELAETIPAQETGAGEAEGNVAAGGIMPGSGESAQGIFFGAVTVVKQIWQGGGASNPAVMDEASGAGTFVDLGAGTSVDLGAGTSVDPPNIALGAGEAEGSVATGGNVPGGAGSVEESLFDEAAATSAMMAVGATTVKQLWVVGGASNSADVVGSQLGSGGNVLAGEAAVAQHEFAETIPVQETGAEEAEENVAAGGIVPGSSEPVVESSLGEIAATGAMLTSSSTVSVEEIWPGASANIRSCEREFYERHSEWHGTYPFPLNRPKGKVKIINNKFLGQGDRWEIPGTEVDIRNLETLWRNLGFLADIEEDLTAEEMCSSCAEFARNIGNVSSVFLIILSHGGMQNGQECIYGNDRCMVQREKIVSYFATHNCPHLTGVAKVFMFEACRGSLREEHRVRAGPGSQVYVPPSSGRLDMLIVYPSQSGYVSFYGPRIGSWLIEAFTYIFSRHAHDTDVGRMLIMVNRRIADRISLRGDVQASNQENYLTKDLYLFPGIYDASRPTS